MKPQLAFILRTLKIVALLAVVHSQQVDYDSHQDGPNRSQESRNASSRADWNAWVEAARIIINRIDCDNTSTNGIGGRRDECQLMKTRPFSRMNLFVADSSPSYRLETILVDKYFKSSGAIHDAVLVIDPFPRSKVGHVLLVFFVDLNRNEKFCADIPKAVRAVGKHKNTSMYIVVSFRGLRLA